MIERLPPSHPAEFARARFNTLPVEERQWLTERVAEIVVGLHTGNIVEWRVSREEWAKYAQKHA